MSATFGSIPTVPSDDPRRAYDGFTPHPDVPVESTSILATMDDEEFEWTQGWIDQYWEEADEVVRMRNEEVRARRAGVRRKRSGDGAGGSDKKRLKVSDHWCRNFLTDYSSSIRTITSVTRRARHRARGVRKRVGLVSTNPGTKQRPRLA